MGDKKKMETCRIILMIFMWILILGFVCNIVMQTVSYSFYKNAKQDINAAFLPKHIQLNEKLSGYGYNLENNSDKVILFFGGSNYIAYNSVAKFGGIFDYPFVSADYYGSQESLGKMNLKSMQKTATDLYDWTKKNYPDKKIVVMGHSYGSGIAAYLASKKTCDSLVLLAAYRDLSDLYNKIIPIFWGPLKIFISNNILLKDYAKNINCNTYIIGSTADKTLNDKLQKKVCECFSDARLMIFNNVQHEKYLLEQNVVEYINAVLSN